MGKAKQRRTADGGDQRRESVVGWDGGFGSEGFGHVFIFYFLFCFFWNFFPLRISFCLEAVKSGLAID